MKRALALITAAAMATPAMANSDVVAGLIFGTVLGHVVGQNQHRPVIVHPSPQIIYQPPPVVYQTPPPVVYQTPPPPPVCEHHPVHNGYGQFIGWRTVCR